MCPPRLLACTAFGKCLGALAVADRGFDHSPMPTGDHFLAKDSHALATERTNAAVHSRFSSFRLLTTDSHRPATLFLKKVGGALEN